MIKNDFYTLTEEIDLSAITSDIEMFRDTSARFEPQLSHVISAIVPEENLTTWLQVSAQFLDSFRNPKIYSMKKEFD